MPGTYKAFGEIDTATAPGFNAELHDLIDNSDEAVVSVDCSGVTFMDSAGYHELVDATNYAVRRGHTLVLRNLLPSVVSLFRFCDTDGVMCVMRLTSSNSKNQG